jgi:hypothetical protein
MKKHILRIAFITVLAVCLGLAGHAATLTISPKTIAENYRGWLTVTLSGLPDGATAMLELAADFDGDGTFDSRYRLRFFPVTDGVLRRYPSRKSQG